MKEDQIHAMRQTLFGKVVLAFLVRLPQGAIAQKWAAKFSAAGFVKNQHDKLHYVSGCATGATGGYNTSYPGTPHTDAKEISVKF